MDKILLWEKDYDLTRLHSRREGCDAKETTYGASDGLRDSDPKQPSMGGTQPS